MSTKKGAVKTTAKATVAKKSATKKVTEVKAVKTESKPKKVRVPFDYSSVIETMVNALKSLNALGISAGNTSVRHNSVGVQFNGKGVATLYAKKRGITIGSKEATHKAIADKVKVVDSKFYPNYTYQWEDTVLVEDLEKAIKALASVAQVVAPKAKEVSPKAKTTTKVAAAKQPKSKLSTTETAPKKRPEAKKPAKKQTIKPGTTQPKTKK